MKNLITLTLLVIVSSSLFAAGQSLRWTGSEDTDATFSHVINVINLKTNLKLTEQDFKVIEDRTMATHNFKMWVQLAAGTTIANTSLRVWSDLKTQQLIQLEAVVENPAPLVATLKSFNKSLPLGRNATLNLVKKVIQKNRDDKIYSTVNWSDSISHDSLLRTVRAKGKRGYHVVTLSIPDAKVLNYDYQEFPQSSGEDQEFSLPAKVYPLFEENEITHEINPRITAELRYLKKYISRTDTDPYAPLRSSRYFSDKLDLILGQTEAGRAAGFWSPVYIKEQASLIKDSLPASENSFRNGGIILQGRYASVNLHPDVPQKFLSINFTAKNSAQLQLNWISVLVDDKEVYEMIPQGTLLGRPILSNTEALSRPARRLSDHDPTSYINDGFDELQVYYAINTLFDSLRPMGFTDPELSTRPFNAFLFDPDISSKDNAYYNEDTINFSTYSPGAINLARDNSTIWHELGHGLMDRLMGDRIRLADTGGLSEGLADFIAAVVIADVTNGKPFSGSEDFRIINNTGFNLTNEVHDDGEAYGGAMRDLMQAAMDKEGQIGLKKITDLTLESMRLTRNHPALTAQEWFSHMIFADQLGHEGVRQKGELAPLILKALAGRNFNLDGTPSAEFILLNGADLITSDSKGGRENPIEVTLPLDGSATYHLSVMLKNSDSYKFEFPVQVKVVYRTGPLQGAIHWQGEEKVEQVFTLNSPNETLPFDVTVNGTCDEVNREDGSCVDFAYIQIWNKGNTKKPVAKKRFYLRLTTQKNLKQS